MAKTVSQIAKIQNTSQRVKADQAYDKSKGIKQGSPKDQKIDKKTRVYDSEYGKGGKKY